MKQAQGWQLTQPEPASCTGGHRTDAPTPPSPPNTPCRPTARHVSFDRWLAVTCKSAVQDTPDPRDGCRGACRSRAAGTWTTSPAAPGARLGGRRAEANISIAVLLGLYEYPERTDWHEEAGDSGDQTVVAGFAAGSPFPTLAVQDQHVVMTRSLCTVTCAMCWAAPCKMRCPSRGPFKGNR